MTMTSTPSGLQYDDTTPGTGASPTKGKKCVMHYTGWLWENSKKGAKFDSSLDRGQPFAVYIDYAHTDAALDAALRSAREVVGGGKVRVASSPTLSANLMPGCIAVCADTAPGIQFLLLDRIQQPPGDLVVRLRGGAKLDRVAHEELQTGIDEAQAALGLRFVERD